MMESATILSTGNACFIDQQCLTIQMEAPIVFAYINIEVTTAIAISVKLCDL